VFLRGFLGLAVTINSS